MVTLLRNTDSNFTARFEDFITARRDDDQDVSDVVRAILTDVRTRGDVAVFEYTSRFDKLDLTPETIRVSPEELANAKSRCAPDVLQALKTAAERIDSFHRRHLPEDDNYTDDAGVSLGARWTPVAAAGIYVPGGKAVYPSSVLMNAMPAKCAGVERIVMVVPAPNGDLNPLVLAAAELAGITEIYKIGGAQAIGALAYGTESISPVDVITGPGNAFVAAAKREVFGTVGIDMIAGPSEILVVADGQNNPRWIAMDLLSQAEHDEVAQAILITDDADFARATCDAVEDHLKTLPRADIARKSWNDHGAVIVVETMDQAIPLVNRLAPEHLELAIDAPRDMAAKIPNAGSIFLGRYTPEAVGDYVAGPNHVLPTARSARFSSGLNVLNFMKRNTLIECTRESLAQIGPAAMTLAEEEGLQAHGRSIGIRLNNAPTEGD
ncbi:histidinol dehydrogenase [Paremcibacter congregatus]|uniref:histidinol dehydrogenase n=1 Tax=Paremcibacter congregatus TaxID=2043170 RepID=UPI0030EC0698|tara:strand:- start:4157 stop:5467 length:1311 start_codon:yes stop_codon:yes gene_type:complete